MKKIIAIQLILLIACFISGNVQAQPPANTGAYLQTIVNNKAQYIGQPFSVLLSDLQIPIKFFSPFAKFTYAKSKETSTSFSFYFPQNANEFNRTFPKLEIVWQTYLDKNQSNIIRATNNNRGQWNPAAVAFYSTGIVADIKLRN